MTHYQAAPGIWLQDPWRDIADAPREHGVPRLVLQRGKRYIAEWDDCSGYFFALIALDGVDENMEFPGRLYGAEKWCDFPPPPCAEK